MFDVLPPAAWTADCLYLFVANQGDDAHSSAKNTERAPGKPRSVQRSLESVPIGHSPSIRRVGNDPPAYIWAVVRLLWYGIKVRRGGVPVLPTLQSELTLLNDPTRQTCLVHSLVVDHLLIHSGHAVWVDCGDVVATQPLLNLVPSRRFLKRVTLARGLTPRQHQLLVREALLEQLNE